jgi:hypothetical protein
METHIADITGVIQLAVAPVFLLTAIGTLITALNNRLGRAVDRRRVVQERLQQASQEGAVEARAELKRLGQRSRLIDFAILAAVSPRCRSCVWSSRALPSAHCSPSSGRSWSRCSSSWRCAR